MDKLLVPGTLGGLAGLLVASKSARELLTKYGTNTLLVGSGAVAGTVLWNKYKDKVRTAHQDKPQLGTQNTPLDERTRRLTLALAFAAKSDGHIDAKEHAAIDQQLRGAGVGGRDMYSLSRQSNNRWIHNAQLPGPVMKKKRWRSIS